MQRVPGLGTIPADWEVVRLGDVAFLRKEQMRPLAEDLTPYVGLEHIGSGGSLNGRGRAGELISNKTVFHSGDTLYGKLRPNLRKVIRVAFDGVCSTDILAVACGNQTDHLYLTHVLRGEPLHEHAIRGTAGTKMPSTSWNHLAEFHFPLPPLPEQRAIAAVLDSIDDAIEGAEAVIAATGQLRDSLLHDLLTRGLPGQPTEFRDVPGLGTIPADWQVVRLGEVVPKFEYGTSVKCSSEPVGMPILRIPNIASGQLNLNDLKYAELGPRESASVQLEAGDILLVRTNGNPDICGQCWVSDELVGTWGYASYLVRGRADRSVVNPWFVGHFLKSEIGRRLLKGNIRTSAGNYNLSVGSLGSMPLPCPPLNEQDSIVDTIRSLSLSVAVAREEQAGLRLLKESTADALLTGRLRVATEG